MLNVAERERWVKQNPLTAGDALINIADERKRERILTKDEETLLLGACTGRRAHLRPIILCALDTGMRLGEILKALSNLQGPPESAGSRSRNTP